MGPEDCDQAKIKSLISVRTTALIRIVAAGRLLPKEKEDERMCCERETRVEKSVRLVSVRSHRQIQQSGTSKWHHLNSGSVSCSRNPIRRIRCRFATHPS